MAEHVNPVMHAVAPPPEQHGWPTAPHAAHMPGVPALAMRPLQPKPVMHVPFPPEPQQAWPLAPHAPHRFPVAATTQPRSAMHAVVPPPSGLPPIVGQQG
jgi:hypothetical protein